MAAALGVVAGGGAFDPPSPLAGRSTRFVIRARVAAAMTAAAAAQCVAWCGAVRAESVARAASMIRLVPSIIRAVVWSVVATIGRALAAIATVRWD